METIKEKIKKLAELQRHYKQQRKSVNFKGVRPPVGFKSYGHYTYETFSQMQHAENRNTLRWLYGAYHLLRGKDPKEIRNKYYDSPQINNYVKKYSNEESLCNS